MKTHQAVCFHLLLIGVLFVSIRGPNAQNATGRTIGIFGKCKSSAENSSGNSMEIRNEASMHGSVPAVLFS
jgi:hypothetical protein